MRRGMPADLDKAVSDVMALFRKDAAAYEAAVDRAVKVPLKQHQFDALVSFHFNTGAIAKASLTKKLNAGDYAGAGAGLMAWTKDPELVERRKAERDLFLHGTYPGGSVTVWGVTDAGRVIWKPQRRLNMPQFLALLDPGAKFSPAPVSTTNPLGPLSRLIAWVLGGMKLKG
jgi:lysozyme